MLRPRTETKVKGQDKVDRLRRELARYPKAYVSVGIHEDAGKYQSGDVTVIEVALWNEFGTKDVPERSYFRSTLEENAAKIESWRAEMLDNIVHRGWTVEKALEAVGLRIQVLLQNKVKSDVPPPYGTGTHGNTPRDVERAQDAKRRRWGSSRTLIASGLMLRSITFRVVLA